MTRGRSTIRHQNTCRIIDHPRSWWVCLLTNGDCVVVKQGGAAVVPQLRTGLCGAQTHTRLTRSPRPHCAQHEATALAGGVGNTNTPACSGFEQLLFPVIHPTFLTKPTRVSCGRWWTTFSHPPRWRRCCTTAVPRRCGRTSCTREGMSAPASPPGSGKALPLSLISDWSALCSSR